MNRKTVVPVVDLLLLAIVSMILVLLTPEKTVTFIPAMFFLVISFVVQLMPLFQKSAGDVPLNAAMYVIDGIYLIAQVIFSILSATIFSRNVALAWIGSMILLLLYISTVFVFLGTAVAERKRTEKIEQKISYIKKITMMLEVCKNETQDFELQRKVTELLEAVRYSDPNSTEEAAEAEMELFERVEELLKQIKCNKLIEAKESCAIVEKKIKERNLMCRIYKK